MLDLLLFLRVFGVVHYYQNKAISYVKRMKFIILQAVLLGFNMRQAIGLVVPGNRLMRRLISKAITLSHSKSLHYRHSTFNVVRCFNSNDQAFPGSELNVTDPEASHLFASEVSTFGIDTALAEQHIMLGNYEEAKKLAQEAMDIGDHTREPNNIYSAYAQSILADALFKENDFETAAVLYRDSLRAYERHYQSETGPEVLELLGALNLIAWTLLSRKDYEQAKGACMTALGMTKRVMGVNSTAVASSMVNLANAYINTGDVSSIPEKLLQRSIKAFEGLRHSLKSTTTAAAAGGVVVHGSTDTNSRTELLYKIAITHLTLGNLYYLRGEDSHAETQYERVYQMFENHEFHSSEAAAAAMKNLATLRWRAGHFQNAQKLLANCLHILEKSPSFGTAHEQTKKVREMLLMIRKGFAAPKVDDRLSELQRMKSQTQSQEQTHEQSQYLLKPNRVESTASVFARQQHQQQQNKITSGQFGRNTTSSSGSGGIKSPSRDMSTSTSSSTSSSMQSSSSAAAETAAAAGTSAAVAGTFGRDVPSANKDEGWNELFDAIADIADV